jgi:hypothetical protein
MDLNAIRNENTGISQVKINEINFMGFLDYIM